MKRTYFGALFFAGLLLANPSLACNFCKKSTSGPQPIPDPPAPKVSTTSAQNNGPFGAPVRGGMPSSAPSSLTSSDSFFESIGRRSAAGGGERNRGGGRVRVVGNIY